MGDTPELLLMNEEDGVMVRDSDIHHVQDHVLDIDDEKEQYFEDNNPFCSEYQKIEILEEELDWDGDDEKEEEDIDDIVESAAVVVEQEVMDNTEPSDVIEEHIEVVEPDDQPQLPVVVESVHDLTAELVDETMDEVMATELIEEEEVSPEKSVDVEDGDLLGSTDTPDIADKQDMAHDTVINAVQ